MEGIWNDWSWLSQARPHGRAGFPEERYVKEKEMMKKAAANAPAMPETSRGEQDPMAGGEGAARQQDIATAAYYRAEARGFAPGNEMEDWLEAEKEIELDSPGKA